MVLLDRYQPEGKVLHLCIHSPAPSKQVCNPLKGWTQDKMISLAQLHSIKDTWWTPTRAPRRLRIPPNIKPHQTTPNLNFQFIIDDHSTYHQLDDFSPPGQSLVWQIPDQLNRLQTTAGKQICVRNIRPISRKRTDVLHRAERVYGRCPLGRWSKLPFNCATWKNKYQIKTAYGYALLSPH